MRGWKLFSVVGLALVACGDDDGGGGGGGAIDSKKVSDLSDSEVESLCEWFVDQDKKRNVSDEQFCTQDAAEFAESSEDCEQLKEECIEEIEGEGDPDCAEFDVSASCDVSVSALKKCIGDVMDAYAALSRKASCDEYEDAILTDSPASCAKVPESCIQIEISASLGSLRLR